MLKNTAKSTEQLAVPDPWEGDLPTEASPPRPAWQFPLDPNHEIAAAPSVDGILSLQGDPTLLQISAYTHRPAVNLTEMLLQEELKISAIQAKSLWNHIRDLWALLLWSGPQNQQLS